MAITINTWNVGSSSGITRTGVKKIDQAVRRFNRLYTQALVDCVLDYPWDKTDGELYLTGDLEATIKGEIFLNDFGYDIVVTAPDYMKYHNSFGKTIYDGGKITNRALNFPEVVKAREAVEDALMDFLHVQTLQGGARGLISEIPGLGQNAAKRNIR